MKKTGFILLIVFVPLLLQAQKWERYNKQLTFGLGATNFLGELGGSDKMGGLGFGDIDLVATRPAVMFGFKYQLKHNFILRSNLSYAIFRGDDKYTKELYRRGRNLSFRTGVVELALMGEYYLFNRSESNLYNLKGIRGKRGLGLDVYVFAGIGGLYFNPKAQDRQGNWVELQPLGTEGQGLPGEKDKYSRFTLVIPYGIGIGKPLGRLWSVNFEFGLRKTFSDYIDDVSTDYYDEKALAEGNSELAAYFGSGKAIYSEELGGDNVTKAGEQRGDPNNMDAYVIGMVTVSKKLFQRRRSRFKF